MLILHPDQISLAAQFLQKGELVAFPTETVYGLGAPIFNRDAIAKIYLAKGRPSDNPLIAHISSLSQIDQIACDIPADFYRLAEKFFPGPLTVVLKKHPSVPAIVSGGLDTIAVRMPNHPVAQQLILAVGQPLVAPSANLSGKPSSTTALHVAADFEDKIKAVIDGGETEYGIESTVISLVSSEPCLLRLGAVPKAEIEKVLGMPLGEATYQNNLSSPGTRYRHYAPTARIKLFDSQHEMDVYLKTSSSRRLIVKEVTLSNLYAMLRKADDDKYEEIVIYCSPEMLQNHTLMDRLLKATIP